jgi:hypothetical protein
MRAISIKAHSEVAVVAEHTIAGRETLIFKIAI